MLWIKSLHIFFVICWFAGLFYLPRLFVWHAMTEDSAGKERFKVMERKLYRGIMTPCMVLTLVFGAWMLYYYPGYIRTGWMQAKILLVMLVVIYHHLCLYHMKRFRDDRNTHSHVYFRWFNEAPTVVLLLIIILVVVKPF